MLKFKLKCDENCRPKVTVHSLAFQPGYVLYLQQVEFSKCIHGLYIEIQCYRHVVLLFELQDKFANILHSNEVLLILLS